MLISLWTGRKPTLRTYEMICFYLVLSGRLGQRRRTAGPSGQTGPTRRAEKVALNHKARTLAEAVACRFTLRAPGHGRQFFDPPCPTTARDPSAKPRFAADRRSTTTRVPNTIGPGTFLGPGN
jgi:hypothetical protein